jgi:hypothetical protein
VAVQDGHEYPLDEDAAIFARIEREDRAAEEKLVRRAEKLGFLRRARRHKNRFAAYTSLASQHGARVSLPPRDPHAAKVF